MKFPPLALPVALLAAAALSGCAAVNDATMRALATPAPALAVVGERVLTGEMLLYTDRSGKLQLRGESEPALSCMGTLRYTATRSGTVNLRCSDGSEALLPFTALSETSGHGSTATARGTASVAYGLAAQDAIAYLTAPAGKRLAADGNSLRLE